MMISGNITNEIIISDINHDLDIFLFFSPSKEEKAKTINDLNISQGNDW